MNDVIKRFTLDLQRPSSNEVVYAKGGDTGRKIVVSLTDGGRPYQISADCYAVFTGKKSSGKILNDCTVENNAVVYTITPQNVAAAEKIPCEIRLYNKNNKVITSARFTMIVEQPVNDGNDLTPSEEVEALTKLIGESLNAIDNANGAADELRTARDNGEFDGPKGDPGPEGPQGEPGPAGPAGPAGAGRLDVTRNGNKASHNAMEIYEHTEKGGQVFFEGMQLRYADGSIAIFRYDTTLTGIPYLFSAYRIFENGNIEEFSASLPYLNDDATHHTSTWSSHKIAEELAKKGAGVLNVTISNGKASHTSAEILAHRNNGGSVYCNGLALNYVNEFQATFEKNYDAESEGLDDAELGYCMTRIVIYEDGSVVSGFKNLPILDDNSESHNRTWSSSKIAEEIRSNGGDGAAKIDDTKIATDTTWSSKNTVDKLCPSFTESGSVVACEPVEGYPLEVTASESATTITHCGKNLISPTEYMKSSGNTTLDGDVFTTTFTSGSAYVNRWADAKTHPAGTYTVSVIPVNGDAYLDVFAYNHATGEIIKRLSTTDGYNLTFTASVPCRITICGLINYFGTYSYKLQLEVGKTATEYEHYRGKAVGVDTPITAIAGVNTIHANTGDVTVTGKSDPNAIIKKLSDKVNALSATVTALTGV